VISLLRGTGAVLVALGLLAGCASTPGQAPAAAPTSPSAPAAAPINQPQPIPASGPQPIPASATVSPTRLQVPAIGVDTSQLEKLSRATGGELNPPVDFNRAGYYVNGPAPGDPGPAVIAAHVDDTSGPKVFYRLRELVAGDQIRVTRSDGRVVTFRVDAVAQYPKDQFPTAAVYGPQPGASLRLITCGGSFDTAARSYRDNIVVYASQVPG
jgi:sortase (surface protein transpeptidase)